MTKTIEETANEYAANWEAKHNIHNPELYNLIADAYKASAERIMSLPLAQRLTAEEKERVRAMYSEAQSWLDEKTSFDNPNEQLRLCAVAIQDRLERIFSADFFKEEE